MTSACNVTPPSIVDKGPICEGSPAEDRRFGGIERLYGPGALARLAGLRVAVVGIGGVGSWAAEALLRSGIGVVRLIDLDVVAESNINRQAHAMQATIGAAKVEAMAARLRAIAPDRIVECVDDFLSADSLEQHLSAVDAVLDCIDEVRVKAALAAWATRRSLTLVVCGGAGGKRHADSLRVADLAQVCNDPLLSRMRSTLRKHYGFPPGETRGSPKLMKITCVFFNESPAASPGQCQPGAALACAGYGSAMHMTATAGLAAVGVVLDRLLARGASA